MAIRHTIKNTHISGKKLLNPTSWCGRDIRVDSWSFLDTHHLALSIGGSQQPCRKCIKAIIKELEREL